MYTAIVKPSTYNGKGAKEDTNGYMPILLAPQFGTLPYEHIINGTIAKNLGLTTDACYLITATLEDRVNPADGLMRKQLQVTNLGVISAIELATKRREFIDAMGMGKVEPKAEVSNGYPTPVVAETQVTETEEEVEVATDDSKPF